MVSADGAAAVCGRMRERKEETFLFIYFHES
jgi:hypothetical protein